MQMVRAPERKQPKRHDGVGKVSALLLALAVLLIGGITLAFGYMSATAEHDLDTPLTTKQATDMGLTPIDTTWVAGEQSWRLATFDEKGGGGVRGLGLQGNTLSVTVVRDNGTEDVVRNKLSDVNIEESEDPKAWKLLDQTVKSASYVERTARCGWVTAQRTVWLDRKRETVSHVLTLTVPHQIATALGKSA